LQEKLRKIGNQASAQRIDEVGTLSRALQTLFQRQSDSLEREKHFTRHASHEMRTPVTIITNALAVINLPSCDSQKTQRNLMRVGEACADLDLIISTFLMLGRQQTSVDIEQTKVPLLEVVDAAIKRCEQPIKAKRIVITLSGDTNAQVRSNEALLKVAINNLIRNAANHGKREMSICLSPERIDISNPIESNTNNVTTGYGFGIDIVQRICQIQEWVLKISEQNFRYHVSIEFNSPNVT